MLPYHLYEVCKNLYASDTFIHCECPNPNTRLFDYGICKTSSQRLDLLQLYKPARTLTKVCFRGGQYTDCLVILQYVLGTD